VNLAKYVELNLAKYVELNLAKNVVLAVNLAHATTCQIIVVRWRTGALLTGQKSSSL
jgi:hypothetical protein